jgi:putative peptidoglycan lipid II flippase
MESNEQDSDSVTKSASVVSLGTLTSRVFGLIRDMSLAMVFGASRVTDVFFVAYQIPSLFRKLLGEGSLSSAIVPVYTETLEERPEEADRLASAAFTWGLIASGGITLFGILGADYLVTLIAPGFVNEGYFDLTVDLTRVMFPFLMCMGAAAVVMGVLHASKRFAPSAFSPALLNVSLIGSIWFLTPYVGGTPREQVWALAAGVLVGGFLQFFVQWWALRSDGQTLSFNPDLRVEGFKRIFTMMGPMSFGLAISQLIVVVDRMVASFLQAGNISYLYYSNRLFQFPFALIGIALGTAVLPESSGSAVKEETGEIVETTRESLGFTSFLMIPSMVGLWLIGHPLIGLLFRSGQFGPVDQDLTYGVLFFALIGLLAYGGIRIFVSVCYSFEDTKGPVKAALLALGINAVLDVVLVYYWPIEAYRVCGLTAAGSVAVWGQVLVLRGRLNKHLPDVSLVPWRAVVRHLFVTLIMVIVLYPIVARPWSDFVTVVAGTLVGAGSYMTLSHVFGDPRPARLFREALT